MPSAMCSIDDWPYTHPGTTLRERRVHAVRHRCRRRRGAILVRTRSR